MTLVSTATVVFSLGLLTGVLTGGGGADLGVMKELAALLVVIKWYHMVHWVLYDVYCQIECCPPHLYVTNGCATPTTHHA